MGSIYDDPEVAWLLWERYLRWVVGLARKRLAGKRQRVKPVVEHITAMKVALRMLFDGAERRTRQAGALVHQDDKGQMQHFECRVFQFFSARQLVRPNHS